MKATLHIQIVATLLLGVPALCHAQETSYDGLDTHLSNLYPPFRCKNLFHKPRES